MDRKIIKVAFDTEDYTKRVREGLVQWSYGHVLQVEGLEIPDGPIEVHFSLTDKNGEAPRQIGIVEDGVIAVAIPSFIFTPESVYDSKYEAYAFIYVTDEESGQTIRKIVFTIKSRPKPADWIPPESETTLGQVLEMINGKVEKTGHEPNKFLGTDEEGNVVEVDGVNEEEVAGAVEDYLTKNPPTAEDEIYYFNLNDVQDVSGFEARKELFNAFNNGKRLVLVDTDKGVYAPLMYTLPKSGGTMLYFCGLYGGWSGQSRTLIRYSKMSSPGDPSFTIDEYELTHPNIPTKLSQLEDDITDILKEEWKDVFVDWDAFFEYYDNDLATKEFVEQEIAKFDFIKVVDELPEVGLPNRLYFVPKTTSKTNDLFDEYAWINGAWEFHGTKTVEIDLTNYVKNTDFATISKAGLVKAGTGIIVLSDGTIQLDYARKNEIDSKESHRTAIVPQFLDYAVMKALTDCKNHEWTDEEKASAIALLKTLGVPSNVQSGNYVVLYDATNKKTVGITISQMAPEPSKIVMTTPQGTVRTNTPIDGLDSANKKYVDDSLVGFLTELVFEHDGNGNVTCANIKVREKGVIDGDDVDWG